LAEYRESGRNWAVVALAVRVSPIARSWHRPYA